MTEVSQIPGADPLSSDLVGGHAFSGESISKRDLT